MLNTGPGVDKLKRNLIFLCIVLYPLTVFSASSLPVPLQSALNFRGVPDNSLSVYVEDLHTGEVVLAWNEAEPRNPASVEKMLTTLVALDTLGPAYTWQTEVHLLGDVEQGTLNGDILLRGFGDPFLVTERFWQLLRQVRQTGIDTISGDLLIDDSYFDVGEYDPAAFDHEPLRAYNVEPNALLTNFKVVRYYFEPGETPAKVSVRLEPPIGNLTVINKLKVRSGSCRGYQRGITITPSQDKSTMTLSGNFPDGCNSYAMDRTVLDHNGFTFGLFKSLWQDSGGEISGDWKNVSYSDDREPFLTFASLPLADVITKINKHSNNVMAKQLLLTLGAEKIGPPGTEAKGRQVVNEWLAGHGMDQDEMKLDNGAGLSRNSRMTARQLGGLLRYAYDSPYMPEYLSSLSLSGLDGTLSRRFRGGALTGKAHIKTGSLDDVSAFAGYFQARSGKRYIVVTLQNHPDIHRGPGEEVQEALLRWLYEK
jgi:D-alanyl-D-alanine carboxypeptidase/D-alanyl-D-alanine-endopeptidase (penicillin-binding protein 4)